MLHFLYEFLFPLSYLDKLLHSFYIEILKIKTRREQSQNSLVVNLNPIINILRNGLERMISLFIFSDQILHILTLEGLSLTVHRLI